MDVATYRYYDKNTCGFDFQGAIDDIQVKYFGNLDVNVHDLKVCKSSLSFSDYTPAISLWQFLLEMFLKAFAKLLLLPF